MHRSLLRHCIPYTVSFDRYLTHEDVPTSCMDLVSIRAEICCLQAAQMTISGPNKPSRLHLRYRHAYRNWCSSCFGRSKWIADQTHRLSVRRQENNIESVPRPSGCCTNPTRVLFVVSGREICIDIVERVDDGDLYRHVDHNIVSA
jgi:hypothetical protein